MAQALRDVFWAKIRELHRSRNTGKAYWQWISEFCEFYRGSDGKLVSPKTLGKEHVEKWLNHLANHKRVSEAAHEQAFYAMLFLFNKVCDKQLEGVRSERPKPKLNVPVVMSHSEVAAVLKQLEGNSHYLLLAQIMYGSGLRRSEALGLRIKDVDLDNRQFYVWHSKHKHSRTVPIPESIVGSLEKQIAESVGWCDHDRKNGYGGVIVPRGDVTKRQAVCDQNWYWLFCSAKLSKDPESGRMGRYHLDDKHLGDTITKAAADAGVKKRITCHTFRHSYATHLLMAGVNIREIQRLLGHRDVSTTMIYTHVSLLADRHLPNPLDGLALTGRSQLRLACG